MTPSPLHQRGADIASRLTQARAAEHAVRIEARKYTIEAAEAGHSEREIAATLGVDRMTIRKWMGK